MGVEPEVNQVLLHLSRHLIPPDEILKRRERAVFQIFELLKDKSRFSLDRLILMCSSSSSTGKTGILNSVLDCVIFVNLVGISGISSALENFDEILSSANPKIPSLEIIKRTQVALRIRFKGCDFDLIPAVNFVPRPRQQQLSGKTLDVESEQAFYTLEMISRDLGKAEMYSSSLTETHIRFMKQQSSFIQDLVRISKFWTKCQFQFQCQHEQKSSQMGGLNSNSNPLSLSISLPIWTLIELIAVYAGQLEETKSKIGKKPSVLNAFIFFLRLVEDFTSLKISFLDFDPLKPARSILNFPQLSGGQNSSLRKSRYVIEPSNPFNNIVKTIGRQQTEQLQKAAGDAVSRLVALSEAPIFKRTSFLAIFGPISFFPDKFLA